MSELKRTPLYDQHLAAKGRMVPFAGWEMPVQYSGVKQEVEAVRNKIGMFDVSHMGEFWVTGPDAQKFIQFLIPNEFLTAPLNKAVYSPLLNEKGNILDDLIVYKLEAEKILICVNASNIEKDYNWIKLQAEKFKIEVTNESNHWGLIALQGPQSESVLKGLGIDASSMDYYSVQKFDDLIVARTGYTGEDGFELFVPHTKCESVWKKLLSLDALPCGLAARDVLRLEVCYPLYGHELSEDLTPLDTGLKWTVKLDKENFIGKNTLVELKPELQLGKFILEKGVPRQGYAILDQDKNPIGEVTSGTMSPTVGKGICLGLIKKSSIKSEQFYIEIRGKHYLAERLKKPFYQGGHK